MDSPPSCSLSATGPLSDLGSSGIGGSISSDSVRAHLAIEVHFITIIYKYYNYNNIDIFTKYIKYKYINMFKYLKK